MKRILTLLFVVLLAVEVSGCMTAALLSGKTHYSDHAQEWKITEDISSLVIVGEKQTYVFELQEPLKKILQSTYRERLIFRIWDLSLDADGKTSARYTLELKSSASLQERQAALVDGLSQSCESRNYSLKGNLLGRRYLEYPAAGGFPLDGIEKEKMLQVKEDKERDKIEKVAGYALLPVAIVTDIVLVVAVIALIGLSGHSGSSQC